MLSKLFLPLLLVTACECGQSDEVVPIPPGPIGATTPTPVAAPAAAGTVPASELMTLAGSQAAVTLTLRLDKWSEAMAALRALVGPALPPQMLMLLSFDRPEALMAMAGREAAAMSQVDGLDRTRPIIVRLGEAPDDLSAALAAGTASAPSPLRHVAVIPATQSSVLLASLSAKATEGCNASGPAQFDCDGRTLSLFEHGNWVLVAVSRTPIASAAALVGAPGREGTLAWALDARRPMSAHIRVHQARAFAMFDSAESMAGALAFVSPSSRAEVAADGMTSIFNAFVHMSAFGQEVDTFAFSLRASPPSILGVAQLNATGQQRLALHTNGLAAHVEPSAVTVRTGYDLRSISTAAPDAFTFANAQRPREVMRPLEECGPGCMLRVLAEPIAFSHTVNRIGAEEFNDILAIQHRSDLAPGVIDVDIDMMRVATETGETDLRRMATAVPHVHLHSQITGSMWAGALGHAPNLALEPATATAPRPSPSADQVACFNTLARTTLDAFESLGETPPAQRNASLAAATQAQNAQLGCVAPELRAEAQSYVTALQQVSAILNP